MECTKANSSLLLKFILYLYPSIALPRWLYVSKWNWKKKTSFLSVNPRDETTTEWNPKVEDTLFLFEGILKALQREIWDHNNNLFEQFLKQNT